MDFEENEEHPAYGVIGWSKIQCGPSSKSHMFQSDLSHHDLVAIRIEHATLQRGLGQDWVNPAGKIVEVYLTPAQFTQFITSPNQGVGSPCTIRGTEMDGMTPELEQDNRYTKFKQEIDE
jgi:hypothetical protein